jgi:Trypsin-co-occurring domain 1
MGSVLATVLLKVPVSEGSAEYVEVEVDSRELGESVQLRAGPTDPAGSIGSVARAVAEFSLTSSMDRVLRAVTTMLTRLRSAEHAPDEVSMELGLKVGGETGLIFAKGTAGSTFTLTLTWRKPGTGGDGAAS